MQNKKTIKIKFFIAVSIVALIFFVLVAKGAAHIVKYNIKADFDDHYQLLADSTADRMDTWLLAEAEIVKNQKTAIEIIGNYDIRSLTKYLSDTVSKIDNTGICDLYYVDTENHLATANGYYTDDTVDLTSRNWYRACTDNEELYYSSPYIDLSTGNNIITISVGIFDNNKKFKGVLALDILVDAFFDLINDADIPNDSYVFLIDNEFGVSMHPNDEFKSKSSSPKNMASLGYEKYTELVENIKTSNLKSQTIEDYDGEEREFFVSKMKNCEWYVAAAVSSDIYVKPVAFLLVTIIVALILTITASMTVTFIISRRIIRKLKQDMSNADNENKSKTSFVVTMSQEIRNPINTINGMTDMIIRESDDENIREHALDVGTASQSLLAIINDILDFSKKEIGELEINKEEFNIASLANDVVNMVNSRMGSKKLELIVDIDPDIPVGIIGDELRLRQVILNLMTNSIKYTENGFILMKISFTKREYGINLNVSIKDSGNGMTDENIEAFLIGFKNASDERKDAARDTELSLAITKFLIEEMGGFINCESELGIGTEFRFSIPMNVSDEQSFITLDAPENVHALFMTTFEGMSMPVIDVYIRLLINVVKKMKIDLKLCTDFGDLEHMLKENNANMLFVDRENYIAHEEYFGRLSEDIKVILVQEHENAVRVSEKIGCIFKPFYAMSIAAFINGLTFAAAQETKDTMRKNFVAPKAKVLIVDDNHVNLKIASGLMAPYNINVYTADSGIKAIEILEESPDFDIVFMDHIMPDMNGIETASKIRSNQDIYFKNVPIIALTANTINNAHDMFLRAGFTYFLAKPIEVSMLDWVLRRFLPPELIEYVDDDKVYAAPEKLPALDDQHKKADYENTEDDLSKQNEDAENEEKQECDPDVFDPQIGIGYTAGNVELYNVVLSEYVKTGKEIAELIDKSYQEHDWHNYIIRVHALKSTSLNIGAKQLYEQAKRLEMCGKAGEYDVLLSETEPLLEMFEKVISYAKEYLDLCNPENEEEAEQETVDITSFTEIDEEQLKELAERFFKVCDEFDNKKAGEIIEEANNLRIGDIALREPFEKTADMIEYCEFDKAAEFIHEFLKVTVSKK